MALASIEKIISKLLVSILNGTNPDKEVLIWENPNPNTTDGLGAVTLTNIDEDLLGLSENNSSIEYDEFLIEYVDYMAQNNNILNASIIISEKNPPLTPQIHPLGSCTCWCVHNNETNTSGMLGGRNISFQFRDTGTAILKQFVIGEGYARNNAASSSGTVQPRTCVPIRIYGIKYGQ